MIDVAKLVGAVFSGLSALVIENVADGSDVIAVRARTRDVPVACSRFKRGAVLAQLGVALGDLLPCALAQLRLVTVSGLEFAHGGCERDRVELADTAAHDAAAHGAAKVCNFREPTTGHTAPGVITLTSDIERM
jgi:hypothetical protein